MLYYGYLVHLEVMHNAKVNQIWIVEGFSSFFFVISHLNSKESYSYKLK